MLSGTSMKRTRKQGRDIYEPASFLNIDVDVRSRRSLAPLAEAWAWAQRPFQDFHWLVSSARGRGTTADAKARELVRQINALPERARRAWDLASTRTFDIGVQAGRGPRIPFEEVTLAPETLARVASIRAPIQVTVYPPERRR
jgi:hypothetical protein